MSDIVEIKAVVRREMLDRVIHRLKDGGVHRMTVTKVHAIGSGVDPASMGFSLDEGSAYTDKALIQFACSSDNAAGLVDAIVESGRTGRRGDGVVTTRPIDHIKHIRTGFTSEKALEIN